MPARPSVPKTTHHAPLNSLVTKAGENRGLSPLSIQSRAVGAYLGMAVGDALGATVEFMTPMEIHSQYGIHDTILGGGWLHLKPGQVTDDTSMSLALGRAVLKSGRVEAEAAAQAFDDWMRAKPVDIGNTVRRGIIHFRRSGSAENPVSEHDAGNGACMRCLPVALATFNCQEEAVEASRAQAHVTHNNPLSDAATECVIEVIHGAMLEKSLDELHDGPVAKLVETYPIFRFDNGRCGNPSGFIADTLRAVFQALFAGESFEAAMIDVVNRGGDADTTGAILGMIAGAYYGLEAIPAQWLKRLDKKTRQECEAQARALIRLG
jgi:ADP-ribosyl-[dinitrogen reductase] hydrolase